MLYLVQIQLLYIIFDLKGGCLENNKGNGSISIILTGIWALICVSCFYVWAFEKSLMVNFDQDIKTLLNQEIENCDDEPHRRTEHHKAETELK